MQIRLSWQLLGAIAIFLIGALLLGRFLLTSSAPPAPPAVTAPAAALPTAPTATTAATPSAASATTQPIVAATPTAPASPTAVASTTPSATAPAATSSATPEPTPAPLAIELVNRGFGQSTTQLGYGFIVRNPNPELIARDLPFQVIIYDEGGIILRTDAGSVPIVEAQGEASSAALLPLPADLQAASIDVLLGEPQFLRAAPQPVIRFENVGFVPGEEPKVTGLVRSPLSTPLQGLPVVALVFDAQGAIIGGGADAVPFLPAGGQAAAEVAVAVSGDVAAVQLYARPAAPLAP